jgi:diphthamide biosynthesis methyltransferase
MNGLHTICLIDPSIENGLELLNIIKGSISIYEKEHKKNVNINYVFYIKNAGCKNEKIGIIKLEDIKKVKKGQDENITIVVPSKMNEIEKDFTSLFSKHT